MKQHRWFALGSLVALASAAGTAHATKMRHPLTTSHRVNFGLDHGGKDYACGSRFYSGHRGNDFSVGFGSQVVASAAGVVQTVCRPHEETCNQRDDDCDGQVDEDEVCKVEPPGGSGGSGGTAIGGSANGGRAGGGAVGGAGPSGGRGGNAGAPSGNAGRGGTSSASGRGSSDGPNRITAGEEEDAGGCGCRATGGEPGPIAGLALLAATGGLVRRRRRGTAR